MAAVVILHGISGRKFSKMKKMPFFSSSKAWASAPLGVLKMAAMSPFWNGFARWVTLSKPFLQKPWLKNRQLMGWRGGAAPLAKKDLRFCDNHRAYAPSPYCPLGGCVALEKNGERHQYLAFLWGLLAGKLQCLFSKASRNDKSSNPHPIEGMNSLLCDYLVLLF